LGYAPRQCTVRFLGTLLADPIAAPPAMIAHLAKQLDITEPSCLLPSFKECTIDSHHHSLSCFGNNPRFDFLADLLFNAFSDGEYSVARRRIDSGRQFPATARPRVQRPDDREVVLLVWPGRQQLRYRRADAPYATMAATRSITVI
jgi:hypothetical protein